MTGVFIWAAIISMVAIRLVKNKSNSSPGARKQSSSRQEISGSRAQKNQQKSMQQKSIQQKNMQHKNAQQKNVKQKRIQQAGRQPQNWQRQSSAPAGAKKTDKDDILSRASANAELKFSRDTIAREPEKSALQSYEMQEYSSCMQEVWELITCGYQGNLKFERDFLGEAEDMLNRYYQIKIKE